MRSDFFYAGFPDRWKRFEEDNQLFLEKLEQLYRTINATFARRFTPRSVADKVIFALGRVAVEDFNEIALLAVNGYGVGAGKLLRGMYERVVTASYISRNADKAQRFLDYYPIYWRRMFNHATKLYDMSQIVTDEIRRKMQAEFERVKEGFEESICKKCGTKRIAYSWSPLDLASMAAHAEEGLKDHYLPCYYMPTQQAHATVPSLLARLKHSEKEDLSFEVKTQEKQAEALSQSHALLLAAIRTQNTYFDLGLDSELEQRVSDWMLAWKPRNAGRGLD